jgi:hypothetical protein
MKHILDDSATQSSLEIFYKKYILVVILLPSELRYYVKIDEA